MTLPDCTPAIKNARLLQALVKEYSNNGVVQSGNVIKRPLKSVLQGVRVKKSTNMDGFDKYLDLVFDGFDYVMPCRPRKIESELILRIYVLKFATS